MIFDPSDPVIDESLFDRKDWTASEFGLFLEEVLPKNIPQPRGMRFLMWSYVDADHVGGSITRRYCMSFLVYLNCTPVYWMSKKQTSVETSSFGSEFIAMKQCTKYIRGLLYKLRMMGIPCTSPAFIFGDNQSVLANTTIPDSTLKKKSQSIAYHFVCEGAARDEWRTTYMNTHLNRADLLTKPLPSGEKLTGFVRMILHYIFGWFYLCFESGLDVPMVEPLILRGGFYFSISFQCSHWVTDLGLNSQLSCHRSDYFDDLDQILPSAPSLREVFYTSPSCSRP